MDKLNINYNQARKYLLVGFIIISNGLIWGLFLSTDYTDCQSAILDQPSMFGDNIKQTFYEQCLLDEENVRSGGIPKPITGVFVMSGLLTGLPLIMYRNAIKEEKRLGIEKQKTISCEHDFIPHNDIQICTKCGCEKQ